MDHRYVDSLVPLPLGSSNKGINRLSSTSGSNLKKGQQNKQRASGEDWNGVWHYEEDGLVKVANTISTFLSSLLPTTSILVLYFVKAPLARLAAVMVFTALFSLTLAIVAKARKADVFAATTA